jgi:hypothetical protein
LISLNRGLREEIVLTSADAPDRFLFPLKLKGLTASVDELGDVVYKDSSGKERARTPKGFMYDSKIDRQSGEPAHSDQVSYSVVPYGNGFALQIQLDRNWIGSRDRVLPIVVDPALYIYGDPDDTYVMSPFNADYSADTELKVGTFNGGTNKARSFIHFNTSTLAGMQIDAANLIAYEKHSYNCAYNPEPAYRVTSEWQGSNLRTFEQSPAFDPGSGVTGAWGGTTCGQRYAYWVVTDMVRYWANTATQRASVALRATSETDSHRWKKYHSQQSGAAPLLQIAYTDTGNPFGSLDDAWSPPPATATGRPPCSHAAG